MKNIKKALIIFIISLSNIYAGETIFGVNDYSLGAQELPYSYAGLARGFEIGNLDSLRLNFVNFSGWTRASNPTYGVKLGYTGALAKSKTRSNYFNDYANFQGGFLGIPILKQKLVVGIGIQPVTNVEQSYKKHEDNIDKYVLIKGGTSKAIFNIAYSVNSFFKIGIGYEYNFGEINRNFRIELPESNNALTFEYQYRYYGNGAVLSAHINPLKNLGFGLVYRPSFTERIRIKPQTNSKEVNISKLKKISIPAFYGAGLQYDLTPRTSIGMDLLYQDWGKGYKIEGKTYPNLFTNYYRISGGIEKRQSHKLFTSFAEKLDYRAGIFYGKQNYLSLANDVYEYGFSLGLSLPITRFRSRLDLSALIGRRGNLSLNQYEETFFMFGFTINAKEVWFVNLKD